LDLSSIRRERVKQQFHHRKEAPKVRIAQSCPCHRQRATEKIALAASAFVTCCCSRRTGALRENKDEATIQTTRLKGVGYEHGRCPLWVRSRHVQRTSSCPLYPQ